MQVLEEHNYQLTHYLVCVHDILYCVIKIIYMWDIFNDSSSERILVYDWDLHTFFSYRMPIINFVLAITNNTYNFYYEIIAIWK